MGRVGINQGAVLFSTAEKPDQFVHPLEELSDISNCLRLEGFAWSSLKDLREDGQDMVDGEV